MVFWQCGASAVTMHPASSNARNNSGTAVISLALGPHFALAQQQAAPGGPRALRPARQRVAPSLLRVEGLKDAVAGVVRGRRKLFNPSSRTSPKSSMS